LRRNFQRVLAWLVASGVLWVAGGLAHDGARTALWLGAVAMDLTGGWCGFFTPGLGRSRTTDWTITGHLAERCQLFIIIALGESILGVGTGTVSRHFPPQSSPAAVPGLCDRTRAIDTYRGHAVAHVRHKVGAPHTETQC